jgi:type II secretory pathway pseudopilin PulG
MTRPGSTKARARGTTLIELIVAITVIAMAVTAVLSLLAAISMRSADAMTSTQAAAIASAYLDEALSKAYQDPYVPAVGRTNLNDVRDYNFIDNGARDVNDNPIPGLGQYTVQTSAAVIALGAVPDAVRVDATVTAPNGTVTRLTGFRTKHAGQVIRQ